MDLKMHNSARGEVYRFKAKSCRNSYSVSKIINEEDVCLSSCPMGAKGTLQYGVATLVKDLPFTARCALSWSVPLALILCIFKSIGYKT